MNILKKIGTPFIAIWRWIKETAWVQPLLIVGIIFAIIFSIPSITKGIQGLMNQQESDIVYFQQHQLSLKGSKRGEENSQANIFFDNFVEAQGLWENGDKEGARDLLSSYSNNGDKFFLFFVQEECAGSAAVQLHKLHLREEEEGYGIEASGEGVRVDLHRKENDLFGLHQVQVEDVDCVQGPAVCCQA